MTLPAISSPHRTVSLNAEDGASDAGMTVLEILVVLLIVSLVVAVAASFPPHRPLPHDPTADVQTVVENARWTALQRREPLLLMYAHGLMAVAEHPMTSTRQQTGLEDGAQRFIVYADGRVVDVSTGSQYVSTASFLKALLP